MPVDPRILAALAAPLKAKPNTVVLPKVKGGYAARPETGPAGETCKSCRHAQPHETGAGRRYWKCALVKRTHGPGTDIALRSPACRKWEAPCG